jgi:hypothetical protein
MTRAPRFWVWFPTTQRWLPASPIGAERCFLHQRQEVAWGVHAPQRPGTDPASFDPLFTADTWSAFRALCEEKPGGRHRIGACHL